MTNGEKYKTAKERRKAFMEYIVNENSVSVVCEFAWLDLEAEEVKPMPCPFCGGMIYISHFSGKAQIECKRNSCGYKYRNDELPKESDVIAAHNRVCKAVAAFKESEVK